MFTQLNNQISAAVLDKNGRKIDERDGQAPIAGRSFQTRIPREAVWVERRVALYPDGSIIQITRTARGRSAIMAHLIEVLKQEARRHGLDPKVRRRPRHW